VFLTGATGFVGMELLARYLERTDRPVYALVRASDDRQAAARLERTVRGLFGADHPYAHRAVAVRGDLTTPHLGLDGRHEPLAEQVSEIVHSGATVSFSQRLGTARAINVDGTRRVLELAERCAQRGGLRRLSHISTAYISGAHRGSFGEDDLHLGQQFHNSYEQSKFEAERLVARARGRLPTTVVRPSIVVGERHTGWTSSFNVLYWPLRLLASGAYYPAVPGRPHAPVDVVPVDYVADAIFALSGTPEAEGGTYHLTAGADTSTVGEVLELAATRFRRRAPRVIAPSVYRRVLHPLLTRASRGGPYQRVLERAELYFPYLAMGAVYDDRRARVTLRTAGIGPSPLHRYFDRLVDFAVAAEWGRRPIPRASLAAGSIGGER